jgi:predicted short-subunit dehydrogenase-like oxidoreductase (DUF2520 family)
VVCGSAILPGMARLPRIAIVGPGNLGTVLALALHDAGYPIDCVVAHAAGQSLVAARRLARKVGARAGITLENSTADLIWFCVPDSVIKSAAENLADQISWKGKLVLHSSGALTSDELGVLRKRGARVGSAHPLMTFVRKARPSLERVPFAIEGDAAAVRAARDIVRRLRGEPYSIRKNQKAAYHAWAAFTSPLLTSLLASAEQVAARAGVNGKVAARRMRPILLQTIENYVRNGGAESFSGPIVRGDVATVQRHLKVLRSMPRVGGVYLALAKAALEYLPAKNKTSLKRVLERSRSV